MGAQSLISVGNWNFRGDRRLDMTDKTIRAIEKLLSRGDRVELIPGPNNTVKVIRVQRQTMDTK